MADLRPYGGATLYELELEGHVQGPPPATAPTPRSSSFRVAALWPEAAALAGQQLFLGEATVSGMAVVPGVRVRSCTPVDR